MQLSGAKLSGSNVGNYSVSYSALLGFTTGQYTVNNSGYSYPLSMYPGFSFSRSSSAYSLNSTKQYPSNTARITSSGLLVEAASTNLIANSTTPAGTGWTGSGVTTTAGQTDPAGGTTGALLAFGGSGNYWEYGNVALTGGVTYVISGYVRTTAGTATVRIDFFDGSTVTDHISPDITVTTAWQRISVPYTPAASTPYGTWVLIPGSGGAAATVVLAFPQMEAGATPTSYIPTSGTTAARAADIATQTYTGTATSVTVTTPGLGAMTYPAAGVTNYAWPSAPAYTSSPGPMVVTQNYAIAPDGTKTATLVGGQPTGSNYNFTNLNPTGVSSTTWTFSVFVKYTNNQWVKLSCESDATEQYYNQYIFDLINGTYVYDSTGFNAGIVNHSATMVAAGNGWWRISVSTTFPSAFSSPYSELGPENNATNETSWAAAGQTFLCWGAQCETGLSPSGYVPTLGAAATFTPSSPFTLSQAPFLGQNIQSLLITGSSGTVVSLDFINNVYSTKSNYSYTTATSTPGFSFTNSTGGYSLDGSTWFGVNYQPYSTNMAGVGTWYPFGGSSASISSTPAPDGSLTATNINLSGGAEWYCGYQTNPIPSGAVVTMSCWLRSVTGTAPVQFDYTSSGDDYNPSIFTVDPTWRRYTWTHTTTFASGVFAFAAGGSASNFLAWGPQIELGSTATAYAPVAGTTYTSAPRITSSGLLVEAAATNLISNTPVTTSYWAQNQSTLNNNAAIAPDGTMTAAYMVAGLGNTSQLFYLTSLNPPSITAGNIYTFSCYVKKDANNDVDPYIDVYDGVYDYGVSFDLTNGVVGLLRGGGAATPLSKGIIAYKNGWYRVWLTYTATSSYSGGYAVQVGLTPHGVAPAPTFTGSGSGVYVWGPQLEQGTSPSSLIPTTTVPVTRTADVATQTYSGTATSVTVTTSGLGAMTYPAAGVTNLAYPSQGGFMTFSNWSYYNCSVGLDNNAIAPDGTATASTITDNGSNTYHCVGASGFPNPGGAQVYSVYLKAGNANGQWAYLEYVSYVAVFDLVNGVVTASNGTGTAGMSYASNGWWRCWISATVSSSSHSPQWGLAGSAVPAGLSGTAQGPSYAGNGATLLGWGAQLETGSTPSGYVPTTTAAATISPASPFTLSQAPFLGQNIQSVVIS